jgi:hypothetical protein
MSHYTGLSELATQEGQPKASTLIGQGRRYVTAAMQRFFLLRPIRFVLEGLQVHGLVGVRYHGRLCEARMRCTV